MSTLAAQRGRSYNFGLVIISIGGIIVGGFDDDGGIEFEHGADLQEKTVGADGQVTFSLVNDDSVDATITLKETSASILALNILLNAQVLSQSTLGVLPPLPFSMFDPSTGDTVLAATAVFMNRPSLSKGRVAGSREFRISLVGAGATQQAGILNVL